MFDLDPFNSSNQSSQQKAQLDQQYTQCLTFLLGGETYALEISYVKEIIEFSEYCSIPAVPKFFRGVLDLRGRPVPIIDLGIRFNGQQLDISKRSCIVIVELDAEGSTIEMGLIIDNVKEVIDIPDNSIEPPPSFGQRIDTQFMSGMTKVDGRFIVILDIEHVLPTEELLLLQEHGEAPAPQTAANCTTNLSPGDSAEPPTLEPLESSVPH